MPVVNVRVTEEGFHVPSELARQLGLRPGEEAPVEIRRAPDRDAVRQLALRYAWRRLGDAVGVEEPQWSGDGWIVSLKVRGHSGSVGRLLLTPEGRCSPMNGLDSSRRRCGGVDLSGRPCALRERTSSIAAGI